VVRRRLARHLEREGTEVEPARDGYEACAKLKLGVDLVVLDTDMPGMDGYDTLREIREDRSHGDIPVLMICPNDNYSDRLRALEAGADEFLCKSVTEEEMHLRIQALLRMKKSKDRLERHLLELRRTTQKTENELREALAEIAAARRRENEAHMEAVRTLAVVAESKDETTGKHVSRIGHYCRLIGELLKLPPGQVAMLTLAATTHDVGKVAVPKSILRKPGKLNHEEWEVMKKHPVVGAEILGVSSSAILKAGKTIALTHHENWDGTGYPQGLRGEEIPLWGRICAVADVFDALTSNRPYRTALDCDRAQEILVTSAGKHLDGDLVELFLDNFDRVLKIKEKEPDIFQAAGDVGYLEEKPPQTMKNSPLLAPLDWQTIVAQSA
jgi:putative two-component system response regulator